MTAPQFRCLNAALRLLGFFRRFLLGIAPLESLDSTSGIHHAPFAGEEWMALAAKLDPDDFPGGSGRKGVTACADDLRIGIVLGVNLLFHLPS